jgi:hypothetical protein
LIWVGRRFSGAAFLNRNFSQFYVISFLLNAFLLPFSDHLGENKGFDLRLPYADQGYVDEDADVMGRLAGFFGGNKKKQAEKEAAATAAAAAEAAKNKKKGGWPW